MTIQQPVGTTFSPWGFIPAPNTVEAQVVAYRDRHMADRAKYAARFDMRGVNEAQKHVYAAGRELVRIAAGRV